MSRINKKKSEEVSTVEHKGDSVKKLYKIIYDMI
jgi:hypothetical protein